jgi:tetratricopeptide (TPR) repeat protein
LRHDQQALGLFRDAGDQPGQALALNAIGWYYILLGRPRQARTFCQQALTLYRHTGRRVGQADTLAGLGDTRAAAADLPAAQHAWQQALDILENLRHPDVAQVRARLRQHPVALQDRP